MNRVVYDIETMRGCYTYTDINIDTLKITKFVIHPTKNQLDEFIEYFKSLSLGVGFNNLAFDYPVIHFMIDHQKFWNEMLEKKFYDIDGIIKDIQSKAQEIIELQNLEVFGKGSATIYEKDQYVFQLDLFKLWHYNNKAKSTSLKGLMVSMNMQNVMECEIPFNQEVITEEELEKVLEYNLNDVLATHKFYLLSQEKLNLRKALNEKYDLPCFNWNNGKIGEQLILKLYCDKTFKHKSRFTEEELLSERIYQLNLIEERKAYSSYKWEISKLKTNRSEIRLVDCIPSSITFKTKQFNSILDKFKKKVINIYNVENKVKGEGDVGSIFYKECVIDYGIGGIHGVIEKGLYKSDNKYIIKSLDVKSLYPNLAIIFKFWIEHLGIDFLHVYKEGIVDVRMAEKAKPKDQQDLAIVDGFKEAANIPYGKSGDRNSPLYDFLYTMKTTVAGQLMLSVLIESLGEIPECKILMVNTDGCEVLIPRKYEELYSKICSDWEKETTAELEFVDYEKIWIGDVNNYGCVSTTGKVKNKGRFEVDKVIGNEPAYYKDNSFRIVPIALEKFFKDNIPVEDTISKHKDIFDFCGRKKFKSNSTGETIKVLQHDRAMDIQLLDLAKTKGYYRIEKDPTIFNQTQEGYWAKGLLVISRDNLIELMRFESSSYKITKQQKVTRYYISNKGSTFIKRFDDGRTQFINKGFQVTIFNRYVVEEDFNNYDLDMSFYLKECYKEIDNIIKKQLDLFS